MPFIEDGSLILVEATIENLSFALNNALLSCLRTLKLGRLQTETLEKIIDRYDELESHLNLKKEEKNSLIQSPLGGARYLLNMIENLQAGLEIQRHSPFYDKHQDRHFNLISALRKSIRGSDSNAAMDYLARVMSAGGDLNYIGRRLIRIAVEDIGLADPHALPIALSGAQAYSMLGSPGGELALANATIYLTLSPKCISVYTGYTEAQKTAKDVCL